MSRDRPPAPRNAPGSACLLGCARQGGDATASQLTLTELGGEHLAERAERALAEQGAEARLGPAQVQAVAGARRERRPGTSGSPGSISQGCR